MENCIMEGVRLYSDVVKVRCPDGEIIDARLIRRGWTHEHEDGFDLIMEGLPKSPAMHFSREGQSESKDGYTVLAPSKC